jgi:signal peptidase II
MRDSIAVRQLELAGGTASLQTRAEASTIIEPMDETRRRNRGTFALTAGLVLLLAQLASYMVNRFLPLHDTYVVNSVLHLTHIRNTGGVFGIFPGNSLLFVATSSLIVVGLSVYLLKSPSTARYHYICSGIIVGAAASNICDRLVYGSVVDFIDIQGIPGWHYVFNVADVAIHAGLWPLLLGTLFWERRELQVSSGNDPTT